MHNSLELENKKYILVHKGKQNLFFQVHLKYDRLFYLLLMILYFFYLVFFCYHQFIIPYLYFCIYFSVSVVFLTYRVVLRTAQALKSSHNKTISYNSNGKLYNCNIKKILKPFPTKSCSIYASEQHFFFKMDVQKNPNR